MYHVRSFQLREQCHWLALATSFLILAACISVTLLWPSESGASGSASGVDPFSSTGDFSSPYHCRECHQAEFEAWTHTTHAQASFDPIFQTSLQRAAEPGECFSCHTTGYDISTGQFALSGVTCEACHGPYRPGHPGKSMQIAASEELCGGCHTATQAEWASSRHQKAGVTCADCHEVHSQKTRASDVANALCADCHRDQIQDTVHAIHAREEGGIHCTRCHLASSEADPDDMVRGQATTGHAFTVSVATCDDCHLNPLGTEGALP